MRPIIMGVQLAVAVALMISVLLQSGQGGGIGALGGAAGDVLGKSKGLDATLSKATIGLTIVFFLLAISLTVVQ